MSEKLQSGLKKLLPTLMVVVALFFPNFASAFGAPLKSNDYFLNVLEFPLPLPSQGNEGALVRVGDNLLVLRRLGQSLMLDKDLSVIQDWNESVQISIPEFTQRTFGERGLEGVKGSIYDAKTKKLYVSLVKVQEECASLEVLSFSYNSTQRTFGTANLFWKLPDCVPVKKLDTDFPLISASNRQKQPNISQAGGRLIVVKSGNVFLSVGNFGDAWLSSSQLSKSLTSPKSYFGKVIEISVKTKQATIFSFGHRNIQGLLQSRDGSIIASEHGPEGGDELNLLQKNYFYGWPYSSFGHDYSDDNGQYISLPNAFANKLPKEMLPLISWVPSIAPSQVIQIEKDLAPKWKDDFLLATLRDQSLRRLKVFGNKVIIDERIPLNIRIRDLVAIQKFLYLLDDSGQIKRIDFVSREKN